MQIDLRRLAWLALLTVVGGCGGSSSPWELEPVSGTVTLDGKPCSGVRVAFVPTGKTEGIGGSAYTDKEGKYELMSRRGGKGTPPGDYRVTMSKQVMPDGSNFSADSTVAPIFSPAKQVLPSKYSRGKSALTATVHKGANAIDFPLTSDDGPAAGRGTAR